MLIFGATILALAGTLSPASENPLALASSGQVQCYQPDDQKRTCRSIAAYRRLGDGIYNNTAIVLISNTRPVTLETTTPVTVKAGAVCGSIRVEDINAGKLRVADRLLPDDEAAPNLAGISQSMAPMINKEICTVYEQTADELIAKVYIADEYLSGADQKVKWIQTNDGYIVAP